jgi:hypothetical protein
VARQDWMTMQRQEKALSEPRDKGCKPPRCEHNYQTPQKLSDFLVAQIR